MLGSKLKIFMATMFLVVIGCFIAACVPGGSDGSSYSGGGGGGSSCETGYCLNNGRCCAASTPYYSTGYHTGSGTAGCYASCPYVGDCGSSTQCF